MNKDINLDLMRAEIISVIRRVNVLEDEHSKHRVRRMEDHKKLEEDHRKIEEDRKRIDELAKQVAYLMKAEEERRNP